MRVREIIKSWREKRKFRAGLLCHHYVVVNHTAVPCMKESVSIYKSVIGWYGRCKEHDNVLVIYSDKQTQYWGKYEASEKDRMGGNVGCWYEAAVFWGRRFEAAEKAGVVAVDINPFQFVCINQRAQALEAELSRIKAQG